MFTVIYANLQQSSKWCNITPLSTVWFTEFQAQPSHKPQIYGNGDVNLILEIIINFDYHPYKSPTHSWYLKRSFAHSEPFHTTGSVIYIYTIRYTRSILLHFDDLF